MGPKLVGVAAVDLTLSDLLAGVEYFREGELSYAFVIDSEGGRQCDYYHCTLCLQGFIQDFEVGGGGGGRKFQSLALNF